MHLTTASALLSVAGVARAFQDTSPFVLLSTSEFVAPAADSETITDLGRLLFSSPQITTSSSLSDAIKSGISKCPSSIYVLAHQPGVTSLDFTADGPTPYLKNLVSGNDKTIRSSFTVSDVVGDIELSSLQNVLEQDCGAGTLHVDPSTGLFDMVDEAKPQVIRLQLPAPPQGDKRRTTLRENDVFLSNLLEMIPTADYTVLYTTSPSTEHASYSAEESMSYEMDHNNSPLVHMELKRDMSAKRQSNDSITLPNGPLFERYQFFTPAIFMGLIVMFFLFSIIFVAVRAIAGLEVTYGAFEKDLSKQQQQQQKQQ